MLPQEDKAAMRTGTVGIVILAAGESARMGQPKQLLAYGGKSLLRRAVDTALTLPNSPVAVVLGAHSEQIRPELDGLPVQVVINLDWRGGMGCSLRAGLNSLLATQPDASAALFLLCDQPHITPELLHILQTEWRRGAQIAACEYESRCGVPAIFDAALFPELLALEGAQGARQVLARHSSEVVALPFLEARTDIDRPEDYTALLADN